MWEVTPETLLVSYDAILGIVQLLEIAGADFQTNADYFAYRSKRSFIHAINLVVPGIFLSRLQTRTGTLPIWTAPVFYTGCHVPSVAEPEGTPQCHSQSGDPVSSCSISHAPEGNEPAHRLQ